MKKTIALLTALIITLAAVAFPTSASLLGDINGDGKVNTTDLYRLKLVLKGTSQPNSTTDINGDSKTNLTDMFILKLIIKGMYTAPEPSENTRALSEYTVIIPDSPTVYEQYAAELLCDYASDNFNIELTVSSDAAAETEYEILIGGTSRAESGITAEFDNVSYLLKSDGGKIVLLGKNHMLGGAVGELTYRHLDTKGAVKLDSLQADNALLPYTPEASDSVILMIGDGMGYNHIAFTQKYMALSKNAHYNYTYFAAEDMPSQGSVMTYALKYNESAGTFSKTTTDSAAAGTAMATACKTRTTYLGKDHYGIDMPNVRELAYGLGYKTGVMTTEPAYKATPAAFTVHNISRYNYTEIEAEQERLVSAGELTYLKGECADTLLADVRDGLDRVSTASDGFFMMIEEAYIDITCSSTSYNRDALMPVMNRFNESIKYAMTFTAAHPDTVLIVTADHETGGISASSGAITSGGEHTDADVPIFAMGQGSERFNGIAVENTEIGKYIASIFKNDSFGGTLPELVG